MENIILSIAGSDSIGGAGIQADLKTITSLGGYGMTAITSITAQNTLGVQSIYHLPITIIEEQLNSILTDIKPNAVKIGMLGNDDILQLIIRVIKKFHLNNVVVDPVMVATSGDVLFQSDTVRGYEMLFNEATLMTPNLPEAEALIGRSLHTASEVEDAAAQLGSDYHISVLIKGGHRADSADDYLWDIANETGDWLRAPHIESLNTHGTGCTLSSAIATFLAQGYDLTSSVSKAKQYVTHTIDTSFNLGKGRGPLHHNYHLDSHTWEVE